MYSASEKSWTLTTGDGTKTVYAQYSDVAGNVSSTVNDSIGLDTLAPVTSQSVNAPAAGSGSVALNVTEL